MRSNAISKAEYRKILKSKRKEIKQKCNLDRRICMSFLHTELYKNTSCVFAYAALNDEINTDLIISTALDDNKKIALPYCTDKDGNMSFYYINSFDDLITGSFGIREPDITKCKIAMPDDNALIIVPGLSFDRFGYRLGYGKGYYDRVLEKFTFISVGLCYNTLIEEKLPVGRYDKKVNYLITEDNIISYNNGGKNG